MSWVELSEDPQGVLNVLEEPIQVSSYKGWTTLGTISREDQLNLEAVSLCLQLRDSLRFHPTQEPLWVAYGLLKPPPTQEPIFLLALQILRHPRGGRGFQMLGMNPSQIGI